MLAKSFILLFFGLIFISLGRGLFFLIRDKGESQRTVKSLTWRIVASLCLFAILIAGYYLGLFHPHAL